MLLRPEIAKVAADKWPPAPVWVVPVERQETVHYPAWPVGRVTPVEKDGFVHEPIRRCRELIEHSRTIVGIGSWISCDHIDQRKLSSVFGGVDPRS